MTGGKQVDHLTSGTVCECSEIEGSTQYVTSIKKADSKLKHFLIGFESDDVHTV